MTAAVTGFAASAIPRPIVATPVLLDVVTRAGGRCECTRLRCHCRRAQRCERSVPAHRLYALPRDPAVPVDSARAMRLQGSDLAAWCGPCWDAAQVAVRAAARAAARVEPTAELWTSEGST